MAPTPLKLLVIDDSQANALMAVAILQRSGFDVSWLRVQTTAEVRSALAGGAFEAVLSNHHLPGFTYTAALTELRNLNLDLPFIVVAAGMDEDVITRAMRLGAHDFICRSRIVRLGPALQRELRHAAVRRGAEPMLPPAFDEEALLDWEESQRALVDNMDEAYVQCEVILDDQGRTVDCRLVAMNPAFGRLTGFPLAEGGDWTWLGLYPGLDPAWIEAFGQVVATGEPYRFKDYPSGQDRHFAGVAFRSKAGHFAVLFNDVTDRMAVEASHSRLAMAVDQAAEAVFITDLDGRIVYVNPAFTASTGHTAAEALGQPLEGVLPAFPAPTAEVWQGRAWTRKRDGSSMQMDGTMGPVRDAAHNATGFVGVLRDVTQEVETERNLRHMEKMDALGALAGGVAHDFNNILTAILSASELIEWQVAADSPIQHKLRVIYQAVMRARELNRQILSFSRGSEEKHIPFDLSAVVKEAIYLLRTTFPATVSVATDLTSGLWVAGDPSQVHQVVMNLAVNALQAMTPAGGALTITLGEQRTVLPGGQEEDAFAVLSVQDTGCGMDAATQERIFEPFFTTKALGGGTGLGLSVVHGIVRKHLGTMSVHSEVGRGSTFKVLFPCTAHQVAAVEDSAQEDFGGTERILLVDDEEVLTALGKQGLQMLGYRVTARSDADEALREFQQRPDAFDLLVTDLAMPGMSGVELAQALRRIRPDLPAILVTGAFQAPVSMDGISTPFEEMLFKPVSIQDMARGVRRVLNLRPAPRPKLEVADKAPETPAPGVAPAVLLAEDSTVTRGLLRSWLTKAGYRVQVARDGQEAWEAFTQARDTGGFGLVLTDIVMPRMDGLELAARIRAVDKSIPIVILSSSEDTDSVKEALHLQVNEFLTKPFESAVLIGCVQRMCADSATRLKGLRSMETAQAVRMAQRAMQAVPEKGLPIYSISEPLTDAGGDVFRSHRVADGSIFLAIADVAGHSVISSYAVAAYLGMLSNFVGECDQLRPLQGKSQSGSQCALCGPAGCAPLRCLANKLNRTIQTGPFSEVPICSQFALWNPGTGRLHLLNAGIPHTLWYRHGLGRTDAVVINGAPLGILDEPPMEEKVIAMEPGDRLLLGSDGFFDASSEEKIPFEALAGKLWRDLACTDLNNAINLVSEAARTHASGQFNDDLLVVALEQPDYPGGAAQFATSFPSGAGAIDEACTALAKFLAERPGPDGNRRYDALLAVREALSNAVLHGNAGADAPQLALRACWGADGALKVAVVDEGLGFDLEGHEPPDTDFSERGRGIPMIRHFARDVHMTGGELLMTFDLEAPHGSSTL